MSLALAGLYEVWSSFQHPMVKANSRCIIATDERDAPAARTVQTAVDSNMNGR